MTTGRCAVVVLIAMVALESAAVAGPAASAPTVLGNVQKFYANVSHLTATLREVDTNAAFDTTKTRNGTLWIAKPALFRVEYTDPRDGTATVTNVFDGTSLWMLDHTNKLIIKNGTSGLLAVALSFLIGGNLATRFDVALDTSEKYAPSGSSVLALTPKPASPLYKKLAFVIDAADSHVAKSIVIDSYGNTSELDFAKADTAADIKPSQFQFDPSTLPQYKLIDR
jgi:outer membrane lipoprotein-sorting protein